MHHLLRATLLALSGVFLSVATAAAAPPPIAAFFKRPAMRDPQLSPNGRYLAVQASGKGDRMLLAVVDLETMTAPKIVAAFADADVIGHQWVNDNRLVFQASETPDTDYHLQGEGLWSVDRDGSNFRQLIQSQKELFNETSGMVTDRRLELVWYLAGVLRDGTDEVVVVRRRWSHEPENTSMQLARLDTRTGRLKNTVNQGLPPSVHEWKLDWRGEPRAVFAEAEGRTKIYQRDDKGSWMLWHEGDTNDFDSFVPYWFGPDGLTLVTASFEGRRAVFKLDPKTQQPEARPLLSFKGYDYDVEPYDPLTGLSRGVHYDPTSGRLLGVHYETDAPGTVWFDPQMRAYQADIDAKLKGAASTTFRAHAAWAIRSSSSRRSRTNHPNSTGSTRPRTRPCSRCRRRAPTCRCARWASATPTASRRVTAWKSR